MRGTITPQAAERLVVGSFGLVATVRRRPWWAIQRPQDEVRPWASDLAELLNTLTEILPLPYVQAGALFGSGMSVMVGLGMLIFERVLRDGEANRRRAETAAQEPPAAWQPPPPAQAPPRHSGGARPRPATVNGIYQEGSAA